MDAARAVRSAILLVAAGVLGGILAVPAMALESSSSAGAPPGFAAPLRLGQAVHDSPSLAKTQARYGGTRTIGAGGKALLIQDVDPWTINSIQIALETYRIPHDTVTSSSLAGISLTPYTFIIYASDQPTSYYRRIDANITSIESYVSAGGALLAHVTDGGWSQGEWSGYHVLPGNVQHVDEAQQDLEIDAPNDPVITGKPDGVESLTEGYFDDWNYSAHGYFTHLPAGCITVLGYQGLGAAKPAYITYGYGEGLVRATMTTIEWGFGAGPGGAYLNPVGQKLGFLANELMTVFAKKVFAPNPNGWNIVNGADTKTSDDQKVWKHLFGDDPLITTQYNRLARALQATGKVGIFDGGNCFGFAASAGAYFMNYRHFSDIGISKVTNPWDWGRWERWGRDNVFDGSNSKGTRAKIRFEIEEFQATQWERRTAQLREQNTLSSANPRRGRTWSGDFGTALQAFVDDLRVALRGEPQILSMGKKSSGHAVLAYKLTRKGSGVDTEYRIWIYDNNYPGDDSRFVRVRPGHDAWSYDTVFFDPDGTWSGKYGSTKAEDRISFLTPAVPAQAVSSTELQALNVDILLPDYDD